MHRSGSWFEKSEEYRNALFQIHRGGHPGQETPVKVCMFCMPAGDTTGMPRRPHGLMGILALLTDEEDDTDETEDHRRGLTA